MDSSCAYRPLCTMQAWLCVETPAPASVVGLHLRKRLSRKPASSSLGEKQRPVSVKLMDGQTVNGWIEYYDKHMVRLTREGAPNLFIFKHEIMYIAEDGGAKK